VEGWFDQIQFSNSLPLFFVLLLEADEKQPEGTPKAIIAFYHGFSDHCKCFSLQDYQFACEMLKFDDCSQFLVPVFPQSGLVWIRGALARPAVSFLSLSICISINTNFDRGWGQSSASNRKLRGDYGTTDVVMADLHFFLQSLVPFTQQGSIPLFLMGHSMGGMNSLYYALNPKSPYHSSATTREFKLAGVVSIAPLVAIHPTTQPLKVIEYAGRLAAKLVPKWTMVQDIDPMWVSRDDAVVEAIRKDGLLCHKTGTFEALAGMLERGAWLDGLHKDASSINVTADGVPPLLVAHGTSDRITWFDATKRLVEAVQVKDKTFKEYDGGYHKLTNDTHGVAEQFTADVVEWLNGKIA
jgi:acylglycerol lipase